MTSTCREHGALTVICCKSWIMTILRAGFWMWGVKSNFISIAPNYKSVQNTTVLCPWNLPCSFWYLGNVVVECKRKINRKTSTFYLFNGTFQSRSLWFVLLKGIIVLNCKSMQQCFVIGFHTTQCYMTARLCPGGLGVVLNNDGMPDGLCQTGFLLWVWILPCTTSSACHYKLIDREIRWKGKK